MKTWFYSKRHKETVDTEGLVNTVWKHHVFLKQLNRSEEMENHQPSAGIWPPSCHLSYICVARVCWAVVCEATGRQRELPGSRRRGRSLRTEPSSPSGWRAREACDWFCSSWLLRRRASTLSALLRTLGAQLWGLQRQKKPQKTIAVN